MWMPKILQESVRKIAGKRANSSAQAMEKRLAKPLLLASLLQGAAFVPLAWWGHRKSIPALDLAITHLLQKKRPAALRIAANAISAVDDHVFLNILSLPTGLALWKMRLRLEGAMVIFSTMGSNGLRFSMQHLVNRPRPDPHLVWVEKKSKRSSFPSGHTLASTIYWGWILILQRLFLKKVSAWQRTLLISPILLIGLTGPSRVYLGAHWTSDVLGGYLLGGSWLALMFRLYLRLRARKILL